jgi:hypothetical protein
MILRHVWRLKCSSSSAIVSHHFPLPYRKVFLQVYSWAFFVLIIDSRYHNSNFLLMKHWHAAKRFPAMSLCPSVRSNVQAPDRMSKRQIEFPSVRSNVRASHRMSKSHIECSSARSNVQVSHRKFEGQIECPSVRSNVQISHRMSKRHIECPSLTLNVQASH